MNDNANSIATVLRRNACFQGVEPALIDMLAARGRVARYREAEVITHLGQHFNQLAIVAEGQIELSVTNHQGRRHLLNVLGVDQLYGLIPMLDDKPLYYGALALTPCSLVLLPGDLVKESMHASYALMMNVLHIMCARSRDSFSAMADQHLLGPAARLARHLLTLATHYGQSSQEAQPTVAFSQSELSEMLGMSRQSLNRTMKELEEKGLVRKTYSKVTLPDLPGLRKLVSDEL